jgi:hypothetical protein
VLQVVRPHGDGSSLEGDSSKGQWIKARQRSAFPPNFIHSIDSTHMMMTALECSKEGEWVFFGGGGRAPCFAAGSQVCVRNQVTSVHWSDQRLLLCCPHRLQQHVAISTRGATCGDQQGPWQGYVMPSVA